MTHDVAVHILGATAYDVLKFLFAVLILESLQKWLNKTGLNKLVSSVVQLLVKLLLLAFFAYSALQSHRSSGFDNGVLFAVDCFLLLLLIVVVIYPFIRKLPPVGVKQLNWAKNRNLWTVEHSPEAAADIITSPKGLHFRAQLKDKENRWAKMEVIFEEAQDYRAWAGVSFDIKCDRPYPDTCIRLEVKVPAVSDDGRGSIYRVERPVSVFNGRPIFLFQEMWQPPWSLKNTWGYLNLRQIVSVAVVCDTTCDAVEFYVDNFALVKFTDSPPRTRPLT